MATTNSTLVRRFPYQLEQEKELALIKALHSALDGSPDLPDHERGHMAGVMGVHQEVIDHIDDKLLAVADVLKTERPYQDLRNTFSGFIGMVKGASKMTNELGKKAKELYRVVLEEEDDDKEDGAFLKLPALKMWGKGAQRIRLIEARYLNTIRALGFMWVLNELRAHHAALGKALKITERPLPEPEGETLRALRSRLRDAADLYIKGVDYWGATHPEFEEQVAHLLAPLDEFKIVRPPSQDSDNGNGTPTGDGSNAGNGTPSDDAASPQVKAPSGPAKEEGHPPSSDAKASKDRKETSAEVKPKAKEEEEQADPRGPNSSAKSGDLGSSDSKEVLTTNRAPPRAGASATKASPASARPASRRKAKRKGRKRRR